MIGRALLVLAFAGATSARAGEGALYPAADCAALWFGYGDFAARSAYLDGTAEAHSQARRFRAAAIRLTGDAQAVDAHIARERDIMALMMLSYIERADEASRDMFERLSQTCTTFAAGQPEFQDPT